MKKRQENEVLIHELKSDPVSFVDIIKNEKGVELRLGDRDFNVYDYILLRQTKWGSVDMDREDIPLEYTGRHLLLKILHIQSGYGLKEGYVALSFKVLD